ncbi:MAG: acyl-ACP thioesterase domain-containing protein [Chloroflexota bacterium]
MTEGSGKPSAAAAGSPDPGLAGRDDRPVAGIDNGYLAGYRVRFDEAGADGMARAGTLLRYAQDIAWRHSEALGFDRTWYSERDRWWVVRSAEVTLLEPVQMGTTLRLATAVIGHRKIWARRRGEFRMPDGTVAAIATVDWVLLDDRGRILRIPDDFGTAFPNPALTDDIIRVALPLAPDDAVTLDLSVRPQDLDPMAHVNNATYVDWIEEVVAVAGDAGIMTNTPRRIALEYAASAELGDRLRAMVWPDGDGWSVRLTREADGVDIARARLSR